VNLTITLSEAASWIGYSIDGHTNVTITGDRNIQASDGQHNLVVYANDTTGQMGFSDKIYFTVDTEPPVASFTYSPSTAEAEFVFGSFRWKFNFSASASYDTASNITAYLWDFGDGTNATGITATHEYRQSGTYDVTMKVMDEAGHFATQVETITINPASEPLNLSVGLVVAIVIPVVWFPLLWYYLIRMRRKTKKA
jgi:PKD repeat protein